MALDLVMVGVLALGFLWGWRKGLLGIITGMVGLMLQLYVAVSYNTLFSQAINERFSLMEKWTEYFSQHLFFPRVLQSISILPGKSLAGVDSVTSAPAHFLAQLMLHVLSFVLLFIVTRLLFLACTYLLTRVLDTTPVGFLNRFLGGLASLVFVVAAGVFLLDVFGSLPVAPDRESTGFLDSLVGSIRQSKIALPLIDFFSDGRTKVPID